MDGMKLYICNKTGSGSCSTPCRIFGAKDGERPTDGWETFATFDFDPPPKFFPLLVKWVNVNGHAYSDETLAEPFAEDSAQGLSILVRFALDSPDFVRVAYTARERIETYTATECISTPGEFAEWTRRVVTVKSP